MRIHSLLLIMAGTLAWPALSSAQSAGLQGVVLGGVLQDASGDEKSAGDAAAAGQELRAGREPASLYLWSGAEDAPSAEGVLQLSAGARVRLVGADEGIQLVEVVAGSLVARYRAAGGETLVVRAGLGGVPWVRLMRGALWVNVGPSGAQVALAERDGQATRYDTPMPAGNLQTAPGGQAVGFDAAAGQAAAALSSKLDQSLTRASAEDWLTRAERGDLLPNDPNVAQAQAMVAQAPQVAVVRTEAQAVTQASTTAVTQAPVTGTGAAGSQSTFSGVTALLTSGNPFSVLGAVRVERARIVGVSAAAAGGALGSQAGFLGFNTQVRPPIRLNP